MVVDIRDLVTCFKFGDDRFRGLASAEGQILPFPIDFDGRPYNTLTLPCERNYDCPTFSLYSVTETASVAYIKEVDNTISLARQ